MKKIITLFCITVLSLSVNAQNNFEKELIKKKWKIDLEAMKPVIELMLSENPQMAALDELNKKVAVSRALDQISVMTIEYKNDGVLNNTTVKGDATGTWRWDNASDDLLTKTEDKPEKRFKVIKLNETKLHLKTQDNKDLHLIPF